MVEGNSGTYLGPHTPGYGLHPPHLGGRGAELDHIAFVLQTIELRSAPSSPLVIWGPRGNGKTVLLGRIQRLARRAGMDTAILLPSLLKSPEHLAGALSRTETSAGTVQTKFGVSIGVPPFGVSVGRTWRGGDVEQAVMELLTNRIRRPEGLRPLILLVDEAHTLVPDVGTVLLNVEQSIRTLGHSEGIEGRDGLPLLMVFAGTPDLPDRFDAINTSFWSRLGPNRVSLDLISDREAADAVFHPLRQWVRGLGIPDADSPEWGAVTSTANGYPYFTQAWGQALWRALIRGVPDPWSRERRTAGRDGVPSSIDRAVVEAAWPHFEAMRRAHYADAYSKFQAADIDQCAYAVALGLADMRPGERLPDGSLVTAVRRAIAADSSGVPLPSRNDPRVRRAVRELHHSGFVWDPLRGANGWIAGIPSLASYVMERFRRDVPETARLLDARHAPEATGIDAPDHRGTPGELQFLLDRHGRLSPSQPDMESVGQGALSRST